MYWIVPYGAIVININNINNVRFILDKSLIKLQFSSSLTNGGNDRELVHLLGL